MHDLNTIEGILDQLNGKNFDPSEALAFMMLGGVEAMEEVGRNQLLAYLQRNIPKGEVCPIPSSPLRWNQGQQPEYGRLLEDGFEWLEELSDNQTPPTFVRGRYPRGWIARASKTSHRHIDLFNESGEVRASVFYKATPYELKATLYRPRFEGEE